MTAAPPTTRTARTTAWTTVLCGLLAATATAAAQRVDDTPDPSKIQSPARPFGLDIVGEVMSAGSDDASKEFRQDALPGLTAMLKGELGEYQKVDDSALALDPSKLKLSTDAEVRVYFVGEGASYQNSLGFNTTGTGVASGDPQLIFPNASSPVSSFDPKQAGDVNRSMPLMPGDFVDLGKLPGGTFLDFFLIADGARGGTMVYGTDAASNPDKLNHVVSFAYATKDSPYLIIGFEDMFGGGDRDFNDLIFAVDIGLANIAALTGTPEPALVFTLAGFLAGVVYLKRRGTRSDRGSVPALA